MSIYNCDNCTVDFNCPNKGKPIAVIDCKQQELGKTSKTMAHLGLIDRLVKYFSGLAGDL